MADETETVGSLAELYLGNILYALELAALSLEAQRRGHRLFYVEPGSLSAVAARACGRLASLAVQDDPSEWYRLTKAELRPLADMDVVLVRTDPPVAGSWKPLLPMARSRS